MPVLNTTNYPLARLKYVVGLDGSNAVHLARQLGWYNVQDAGSTGDGVTNDTAAWASIVSALPASGGTIYVPTGTHLIDSAVLTSTGKPINIIGDGVGISKIKKRTSGDLITLNGTNSSNRNVRSSMSGISLDGNGLTGSLLKLWHGNQHCFSDVYMYNNPDTTLDIVDGADFRFENTIFDTCSGSGISRPSVRIRNTANNSGAGVLGYSTAACSHILFEGCMWDAFKDGALWIEQGDVANVANPDYIVVNNFKFRSAVIRGTIFKLSLVSKSSTLSNGQITISNKDAGVVANSIDPGIDWRGGYPCNRIRNVKIETYTDAFNTVISTDTTDGNDIDIGWEGTTPGCGSPILVNWGPNSAILNVSMPGMTIPPIAWNVGYSYTATQNLANADATIYAHRLYTVARMSPSVARTLTLSSGIDDVNTTTRAPGGRRKRVINNTGSASTIIVKNLTAAGTTLKTIAAGNWSDFDFDGTNWTLMGSGAI